jgi:hypothetical protein
MRVMAADVFRRNLSLELAAWNKTLKRSDSKQGWLVEQIDKKVGELVTNNPRLQRDKNKKKLRLFLEKGHLYEAAIFCAAQKYAVRARALEGRSNLIKTATFHSQK